MVDATGADIGLFQAPFYAVMTINTEIVLTEINVSTRSFFDFPPTLYYPQANCQGTPMMLLDMTRFGSVSNGVLSYPTGAVIATSYASFNDGSCGNSPGNATLAAIGTLNVSGIPTPFSLAR